jgi:hypothetical protein
MDVDEENKSLTRGMKAQNSGFSSQNGATWSQIVRSSPILHALSTEEAP